MNTPYGPKKTQNENGGNLDIEFEDWLLFGESLTTILMIGKNSVLFISVL